MNRLDFARDLLNALGVPDTSDNEAALLTWMWAEQSGGQNAAFNPLNIQAGNFPHVGTSGTGQYDFASWNDGVTQTAAFLRQGFYTGIIASLQQGNSAAGVLDAIQQSPWAGGHYGYGLVSQLAGTLGDWVSRVNGGIAGATGGGSLGGGGAGVAPGSSTPTATLTGSGPLGLPTPSDLIGGFIGGVTGGLLSSVTKIVLIGLGVAGGLSLIALGAHRAVTPIVQSRSQGLAEAAPAAATVAKVAAV